MDKFSKNNSNTIQIQQYVTYLNTLNNNDHQFSTELNSDLLIRYFSKISNSKKKLIFWLKHILHIKGHFLKNYPIQFDSNDFLHHLLYGLLFIIIKEKDIKLIKHYYQVILVFYHNTLLSIETLISITIRIIQLDLKFDHHWTLINIIIKEMIKEDKTYALPIEYHVAIIKCLSNQVRLTFKDNKIFLLLLSLNQPDIKSVVFTFLNKVFKYNYDMSFLTFMTRRVMKGNFWLKYNSISFIKQLIQEEEKTRKKRSFYIKKGFVLDENNTPMIIDHISFDSKEFTIIFSFRYNKPCDPNEKVVIFSIDTSKGDNKTNGSNEKMISIIIENDLLYICREANNNDTSIPIERDHDYMIILTQRQVSNTFQIWKKYELFAYINHKHIKSRSATCIQINKEINIVFAQNLNGILGSFHISKQGSELSTVENIFSLSEDYDFISQITYDLNILKPFSTRILSKEHKYNEALLNFKQNPLPIEFSIFPNYIQRLMKHDDQIKISKKLILKKTNEGNFLVQSFRQFTLFQFLKYQGLRYIALVFGLISSSSNDEINLFISLILEFLLDLIGILGAQYFHNEHNVLLSALFNYISIQSHKKTFKINLCLYRTLLEKMNFFNIGDDIDIRNCFVKLLLDKTIYEVPLINENLISLFTSTTTCLKSNPQDLMNKEIMIQLLSYTSLLEENHQEKRPYIKLLKEFYVVCVNNNKPEALEPMIDFIIKNNDMPFSKLYILLKMMYIHIGKQAIVKDNIELSHMMTNILESTLSLSYDQCKWKNLSLCIIYLIFIDCINKKIDHKLLFKLPIDKLCFKYPFMLNPTLEFFKSVLVELFPDTPGIIKARFITNKAKLEDLTFPVKQSSDNIKKKLFSIEKYIEIIIESGAIIANHSQSIEEIIVKYFHDFLRELCSFANKQKEINFLEAVFTSQPMIDFMLFSFNKNIYQTDKLLIDIIHMTLHYINKPFYFTFIYKYYNNLVITKDNQISTIIETIAALLCTENELKSNIILMNQLTFLYSLNKVLRKATKMPSSLYFFCSIITFLNFISTQNIISTKVQVKFRSKDITCIELVFDTLLIILRNTNNEDKVKESFKKILLRSKHSIFYYIDINSDLFAEYNHLGTLSDYSFCIYFLLKILNNSIEKQNDLSYSFLHDINNVIFNDILLLEASPKTKPLLNKKDLSKDSDYWKVIEYLDQNQGFRNYNNIKEIYYEYKKNAEVKKKKGSSLNVSKVKSTKINNIDNSQNLRQDSFILNKIKRNVDLAFISDTDIDTTNETIHLYKKRSLSQSSKTNKTNYYFHTLIKKMHPSSNQYNQHTSHLLLINENNTEDFKTVFNIKHNIIWNTFPYVLRDYLFKNKTFISMKNIFNANYPIKMDNSVLTELNYPTKVKNYTCKSFYLPFVKPDIKFYSNPLIKISHPYFTQIDNHSFTKSPIELYEFPKIIPSMKNIRFKSHCELITKTGTIFGEITLNDQYILFIATPEKDIRFRKDIDGELKYNYVFSSDEHDVIKNSNKKLLIYLGDIEEILSRRCFFQWIGVEIFINTRQTFLINFFTDIQKNLFLDYINKSPLSSSIEIVSDLYKGFKKNNYNKLWDNNLLSTFDYLLMINKYSSRTYNDITQYPIFPWLTFDNKGSLRDLTRPIYDQIESKHEYYVTLYKKNNNTNKFHYSTSGFILYYLIRSNPSTYSLIKFQSNRFEMASRIFNSIQDTLNIVLSTGETRELIPEFFYDYTFMLNLNKNDLGYIEFKDQRLNDVMTLSKSSYQYIADMRVSINQSQLISLWINNVFGINQMKPLNQNTMTMYAEYTYEKNSINAKKIEKWKAKNKTIAQIYNKIRTKISLYAFGMTPLQLFSKAHSSKKSNTIIKQVRNEPLNYDNIKQFLKSVKGDKFKVVIKKNLLCFKFLSSLEIFTLNPSKEKNKKDNQRISITFPKQGHLRFRKESFCQLSNGLFAFCRFYDNTIRIYDMNDKDYKHIIQCDSFITSICSLPKDIFITGDVEGFICKWIPVSQINNSTKFSYKICQKVIGHECEVLLIHYNERLDILLSIDEKNICVLHNMITMDLITIIEVEQKIHDVKISFQDFILFLCDSANSKRRLFYIYTLNGLLIRKTESEREVAGFELSKEKPEVIIAQGDIVYQKNIFDTDLLKKDDRRNMRCLFTLDDDRIVKEMAYWDEINVVVFVFNDNMLSIQPHHY